MASTKRFRPLPKQYIQIIRYIIHYKQGNLSSEREVLNRQPPLQKLFFLRMMVYVGYRLGLNHSPKVF